MKNERITICPNCGEPLVWTFINSGSEWYCINCKNDYPMFFTFNRYSAICTAFKAAPFLILSLTVQNVKPFGLQRSLRIRPT